MDLEWKNFGLMVLFAIIGLLIYSLVKVADKIAVFKFSIFINENKGFWIWAMSLQIVFALLLTIAPDAGEAIKSMVGLDYSEPMSFVTSGYLLARMANGITKDKIGTNTTTKVN